METATMEEAAFHSSKITGDGDISRLETELSTVDGVRNVDVDTSSHTVMVRYDAAIIDRNQIAAQMDVLGYHLDEHADEAAASG
jgi:copper chaperone CopZ